MAHKPYASYNKHPAAAALDEWLASPEGITCTCGNTSGQYLMNRLMRAFQAGYLAAERAAANPHPEPK